MADEDDSQGAEAAEAFEAMRGELALLRRAVEGLAVERGAIDIPDYSETLGRMQQGVDATAERIAAINDVIARSPALAMTPEQMAQRIAAAGNAARREDQAALATGRKELEDTTRQLRGVVVSARRGDEQNRWLARTAISGVVLGMVLWAALTGVIARAVPAGWQWPEKMASRSLAMPMWEGGQRMMRASAPDAFANVAAGDRIITANREAVEACRKRANRAREAVSCTIRIGPEKE